MLHFQKTNEFICFGGGGGGGGGFKLRFLAVAPNNIWGSPFFRTLQCEKTKGIIHSRIIHAIKALPKEQ
jgi:hypothetical protein